MRSTFIDGCGRFLVGTVFLFAASIGYAKGFCFLKAETYYEQTYCEVSAKGYGRGLPIFRDFKKNDPLVQALLLKKPAERSGIVLAMPSRKDKKHYTRKQSTPGSGVNKRIVENRTVSVKKSHIKSGASIQAECQLKESRILCPGEDYWLVGNKNNEALDNAMLTSSNQMGLKPYRNDLENEQAINRYLISSYQHYIEKMLDIGLGGVTMSVHKFSFLFHDLTGRGLKFHERFETMYRHLRKDKANIRVDERISFDNNLKIENCLRFKSGFYSCSSKRKNFIYTKTI